MSENINTKATEVSYESEVLDDSETFEKYLDNYIILENKIIKYLPKLNFSKLIYAKYALNIDNLDNIYRELIVSKLTEDLYDTTILNLVK